MSSRSRKIIEQLTLEEKAALCAQADGSFGRVERLGLAGSVPQDNPRGGADYFRSGRPKEGDGEYHPVAFPSDACLAMSWDEDLARRTGVYFGEECLANPEPVNWLFRPGVNIKRSPLCGRNFEYFSEDPYLAGEMAGAYISGVQSKNVAATLKHYICNNQEFERMTTDAVVSERALREIYLRAFQIAIEKGRPLSVMSSYNKVNGEWVNSNEHICSLLRKELGYEGVVVSDFAAVHHNKIDSHRNGMMDIELAPTDIHTNALLAALRDGRVSESTVDAGLERVFDLVEKISAAVPGPVDMDALHEAAREAAEQCMVLLKNDGILPLDTKTEKLLVVGALAEDPSYMGGGSGHMNGYRIDTYLDEIRKAVPDAGYAKGYVLNQGFPPVEPADPRLIREAAEAAAGADTVIVFAGLGYGWESEGYDRADIRLPEGQRMLLDELVKLNKKLILVLSCGSVLDIAAWNDAADAVLYNSLGGESVASATVNVLFGKAEPGGRLAETWPVCEEHTPSCMNFTRAGIDQAQVLYGEGIYVGYRWYDRRKLPVLYPFGHGLSYTSFEIGAPMLTRTEMGPDDIVAVKVPVRNTGNRAGSQVIQMYIARDGESICDHPVKELKGFAKIRLEAGESGEVILNLDRKSFEFFAPAQDQWIVEDGAYRVMIAVSAGEILHEAAVVVTGGDVPFVYTEMTPLAWFAASEKFHRILLENGMAEAEYMLNAEKFPVSCLIIPLPFYKVSEPYMGRPIMTKEQAFFVLKKMNER